MTKTKAATLLQAAEKARKAGRKVEATERRLVKLTKDREKAESDYLQIAAEVLGIQPHEKEHSANHASAQQ